MENITSPISGQVIKILAQVGQEVTEDTELVIIEAMKMENVVYCDGGTVKEIKVKVGDRVQEDDVLVIIE
jgi:acetyl-CoA carboxylase biotin carboxyl carrier protein